MSRATPTLLSLVLLMATADAYGQGRVRMRQNADDAFAGLDKKFTLRFFDAVSGKPVPGATVSFEGQRGQTNAEGAVSFPLPAGLGPEETRYAEFQGKGYVRAKAPVTFLVGALFFNRYSVSPTLPPGRIRIVLDWGETPKDLDAHLVKKGAYHLSYRNTRKVQDLAWLDRDDQDGHGPETVTLLKLDHQAHYRFFVHDFSHRGDPASGELAASRAHVRIYSSQGLMHTFAVPRQGKGNLYQVFEVVQGQIRPTGTLGPAP